MPVPLSCFSESCYLFDMKEIEYRSSNAPRPPRMGSVVAMALALVMAGLLTGSGLPGNLQKKVQRELDKALGEISYTLEPVSVPANLNADLSVAITDANLFRLNQDGQTIGFIFLGQAPSKTADFDFLVVLDAGGAIIHSAVLIYREEYGGEIGSRRWLRQFEGLGGQDRVSVGQNIDGISGATISVQSMTRAMDDFLLTLGQLQEKGILHEP